MSKFGEVVNSKIPVLIQFHDSDEYKPILREIAEYFGDRCRVITINTENNQTLSAALRIISKPTYMVYKDGEMRWRFAEKSNVEQLKNALYLYVEKLSKFNKK